jgi:hypothetical protein
MLITVNFAVANLTDVVYQFYNNVAQPLGAAISTGITSPSPGIYSADATVPQHAESVRWTSPSLDSSIVSYDIFPAQPSAGTTLTVDARPKPLPSLPPRAKLGQIDVQDVREFIWDRTIADNPIDLDLVFSDDEITNAMRWAAMKYNETPPYVDKVNAAYLPYGMLFLNGVAASLYLSKLLLDSRPDIEYQSGSMTIDVYKRKLDHLKNFAAVFKTDFETMIRERKVSINVHSYFRRL